jgi:hypothetical protein
LPVIVQVIAPVMGFTLTEHWAPLGTSVHWSVPAVNTAGEVGVSVMVTVPVDVDVPVLVAVNEYVIGVFPPAETVVGVPLPVKVNPALLVTVVGVFTVTGQPPEVVQPWPVHTSVFDTEPVVDASTVTWKVNVKLWPGVTPGCTVHVNAEPDADVAHDTPEGSEPQLCEPDTSVVPAGTVSVTTTGTVDVDVPVFATPIE